MSDARKLELRLTWSGVIAAALALYLLFSGAISIPRIQAQTGANRLFHVTLNALPSSLTSPTPIEGGALTTPVNLDFIVIANTDGLNAHTVTVTDCTATTPFSLFSGTSIAAGTTMGLPLGNMRFNGCFKWSSNSTTVQGALVGTR